MSRASTSTFPGEAAGGVRWRLWLVRVLGLITLCFGTWYVVWRWVWSVNWHNWWIAVPLVVAETYALIDGYLFVLTVWRVKRRGPAPDPPEGATADVMITTYNEPIDLVLTTAAAAQRIRYPHETWILDDGDRPELRAWAEEHGIGYITRGADWEGHARHAKAGNLNNALFQTFGEFVLILDADQIPHPEILDKTLGWFQDPEVALVQTPQWFSNVSEADPLGSQAPLFYGPIQQGKDGWNAAFFCGSNAIIRREALMRLGITTYVETVDDTVRSALHGADHVLRQALHHARKDPHAVTALQELRSAVATATSSLDDRLPVADVTYRFQQAVDRVRRELVSHDLASIRADLAEIGDLGELGDLGDLDEVVGASGSEDAAIAALSGREGSPLAAIADVERIVRDVDVDLGEEALPVQPMATISVTEDMATCMRLHASGWKSVYHHEILATGLAPEDLESMLVQRLRWAQGTLQVLLRENPLTRKGLAVGQRLMYFATMWSYLSGFAAVPFLLAPVFYLTLGALPVHAYGLTFLTFFIPYFVFNQLLFFVVGYGIKTWRGEQYSLSLFPVWIVACVTATANVWFGRPLTFKVTPKERGGVARRVPLNHIWPQLAAMIVLVLALISGALELWLGYNVTWVGVLVNTVWVVYDLIVMSVIIVAMLYRPPDHDREPTKERVS